MSKVRTGWIIAGLVAVLFVVVACRTAAILYGDYPDHLARAMIIADLLHGGSIFGSRFHLHFMPVPYLLGDVMLAGLVDWFGTDGATLVWTLLNLFALPVAVCCHLRAGRASPDLYPPAFIVSLYLSFDWFFLAGFLNFRLAIAMVILALALVESLRRSWSMRVFFGYVIVVLLGFLMHLSFALFLAAALGTTALYRLWKGTSSLAREVTLLAPVLLTLAWYAISARIFPDDAEVVLGHVEWGSAYWKLRRLDWDVVRLNAPLDWTVALGFVGCLLLSARRWISVGRLSDPGVTESLLLTVAFIALYVALPMRHGDITYIDVRALVMAMTFGMFALLHLSGAGSAAGSRNLPTLCVALGALGAIQAICLGARLDDCQQWLTEYRALAQPIPPGADVLPVYTRPIEDRWRPFIHASALAVVVDRHALIPNLFSGDRGQPMKYFRYVRRRYAPRTDWYLDRSPVNWKSIQCSYEFVLATAPVDLQRIQVAATVVVRNSSGALLRVDGNQCHDALSAAHAAAVLAGSGSPKRDSP